MGHGTGAKLDIIIPVYNEGETIVSVMDSLGKSVRTPFRALVCYDSDDDNTLAALKSYSSGGFEIKTVKNRSTGVHGAIMTGFEESTADAVLVFPADDVYNTGIIDTMYSRFLDGCDLVAASRFVTGGCMKGAPWLKDLLVRISSLTLYYLAGVPSHDASNGFRLFSRKLLDTVRIESDRGFAYSIELLVKCHRMGRNYEEVPAKWIERTCGKSRFRVAGWINTYLKWYFYAFATTFLGRKEI